MIEQPAMVKDLCSLIGKENVSGNIFERISYGQDAAQPDLEPEKIPFAVAKPQSARGVSEVLRYANRHKIPVYIHGAGTAFKGSPRPKRPGSILLSTQGLTTIEPHEEDMYYELGAGVNLYELEKYLLARGYMLPMTIGSKFASTIGGAVAINTIGHMVDVCVGKIIDYVMGVEVVLPNGDIIESGTRSIRRPAGLDHTRLFVGSEGLFGVITKIRLRVTPDPKRAYIVGFFPELSDIARAFQRHYSEKLPPPLYGEFLDKTAARAPFKLRGLGEPMGHMALAITISHTQEEAERQAQDMVRVFKAEKAIDAFVASSEKEQVEYWEARDNILNILQSSEDGRDEDRLVMVGSVEAAVPLSRLVDAVDYLKGGHSYSALKKAQLFIYGHIGTCDLHGMWVAPVSTPVEERMRIGKEAVRLESELGLMWGCASGEIGQTASRAPFFRKRYGEAVHAMLTSVKHAIDPNNILNPGNLEGDGYEPI